MKRTKRITWTLAILLALALSSPPAWAVNDFSKDANCVAVYDGQTWGTYLNDSKNSEHLTAYPRLNTADVKEGDGCLQNSNGLAPAGILYNDGTLGSKWPGKNGTGNTSFSVVFWLKATSLPSAVYMHNLIGKGSGWSVATADSRVGFAIGSSITFTVHATALSTAVWYHVGVTYLSSNKSYRIRVYDTSTGSNWVDKTGTHANTMAVNTTAVKIARGIAVDSKDYTTNGRLDDLAVFNDVISADDIDSCRAGTYVFGSDPNCVAHWSFNSTNFLADDIGAMVPDKVTALLLNTSTYHVGAGSMENSSLAYAGAYRLDADLGSGFPYQSGASHLEFSACLWIRPDTFSGIARFILGKYSAGTSQGSVALYGWYDGTHNHVFILIQRPGSVETDGYADSSTPLTAGHWYHVGMVVSAANHTYLLRVWDDTAGTVGQTNGSTSYDPVVGTDPFCLGFNKPTISVDEYEWDGLIDEAVVFNRLLTAPEIDKIRGGTYGGGIEKLRADWWWRRRHGG